MIGQSIDMFHKRPRAPAAAPGRPEEPAAQGDDPGRPRVVRTCSSARSSTRTGSYLGPMLTWEIVTEQLEAEGPRGRDWPPTRTAVNQLLHGAGPGRGRYARSIASALATVREAFGWTYGSYWEVDPDEQALRFAHDSGSVGRGLPAGHAPRRGSARERGSTARPGRPRDLVFVADLGEMQSCSRAPVARRAGLKSGVCFPIMLDGTVVGTHGLLHRGEDQPVAETGSTPCGTSAGWSPRRWSGSTSRPGSTQAKKDLEAKVNQLMKVAQAAAEGDLTVDGRRPRRRRHGPAGRGRWPR